MNIDKAIESNQDLLAQPWLQPFPDLIKSVALGNEALKRFKQWRFVGSHLASELLPGETKE